MDAAFDQMLQKKENNVDNLVKWMKDTKIIESSKEAEDKAKALFSDCQDQSNVTLDKFKEVLGKLAAEQGKNVNDLMGQLSGGLGALAGAVKNALPGFGK